MTATLPSNRPRDARWPDCCGVVGVCKVMTNPPCPFVQTKHRRNRIWDALPKCVTCGGGEKATRHVATCHPEHHNFTEVESA